MPMVLKYCGVTHRWLTPALRALRTSWPGISTPVIRPVTTIGRPLMNPAPCTPGSARTSVSTRS